MIKAVLDTVVFVRSLINPYGLFGTVVGQHDKYQLFVSREVVEEYLEVLHRPEVGNKFKTSLKLDLEKIIELISEATVVGISSIPAVSRDPKDDKFLATAKAAQADYLVTEDEDLLDLKDYQGTKIVNTLEFLQVLPK